MARRPARALRTTPLKHRLPNPPSIFVGRERDVSRLRAALARGAVAVVAGPGGIGKTSLVLETLRRERPDDIDDVLFLGVPPDEDTDQIRTALVRLLASLEPVDVDLEALKGDPEATTAAAIDLAERSARWLVLDDVHHADLDEMIGLLTQLASYARTSRWIVTSRVALPVARLATQTVALEGMHEAELVELARALDPDREVTALRRAARAATGSPWLLQQYVAHGSEGLAVTRERILGAVPETAARFLEALSVIRVPLPLAVLATFVEVPDAPVLAALETRGLLQRVEGGARLHDVVRGLFLALDDPAPAGEWKRRAAVALSASAEPDARVEAARLFAEQGDVAALVALLDRDGLELLERGFAPRLWRVVAERTDPALMSFRLRCAAELGNATALAAVDAPDAPDPAQRLAWARTLYARGDLHGARREAEHARAEATALGDAAAREDATLLLARTELDRLRVGHARRELDARAPTDPERALRRDALLALASAMSGDTRPLDAVSRRLRAETPLSGPLHEAARDVAAALELTGRTEAADELLDRVMATPRGGHASLLVARQALLLRARMRLAAGELAEVAELLDAVRPYARAPSILHPAVLELDGARALAAGAAEDLGPRLEAAIRESAAVDARCHLRARAHAVTWAMEWATERAAPPENDESSAEAIELALVSACAAVRAGHDARAPAASTARQRVLEALLGSARAVAAGELSRALELAAEGARLAASAEQRLLQAEALAVAADIRCALGQTVAHEAEALASLAASMGSARWSTTAALALAPDDPALLERIANDPMHAPRAARRARALLGAPVALDLVDALVVRAVAATRGAEVDTLEASEAWAPGWGLDARRSAVWTSEGRLVDLSSRALLWRILEATFERGGAATKEELVLDAWQEREYHPGRHDTKLHVSIRKLREAIEDDPSRPTRLLTSEGGYRLGGPVRRMRA